LEDKQVGRSAAAQAGRSRALVIALTAAGISTAAYGLWALTAIPRGPREFSYQNMPGGNALWPLPFAPLNGFTPEQLSSHVARVLFLAPACVLLGAAVQPIVSRWKFVIPARVSIGAGMLLTAAVALFVLRGVPLQDDESTYLMQADLLARGLVADPTHPAAYAFDEPFTIFTPAGMTGMYLFGTPLVLAPGLLIGVPWLGQTALVGLTLWCAHRVIRRTGDDSIASIGTLLLALSPMFTFTSATALSQIPSLAGVTVATLGFAQGRWSGGAIAGTGLGFAVAARPQLAVPAAVALLLWSKARDRRLLVATALAALPWLAAIALYNYAVMGTPWQQPRAAYTGELERYGFGQVLRDYSHTPLKALAAAGVVAVRLNGWSLGWPISLAGPLLWLALGAPYRAVVAPWAAIAAATFLFQAPYPSIGTSDTGALYHYATLPFIAFSTAAALAAAPPRSRMAWIRSFALASLVLGTTTFYVEQGWRLSRLAAAIEGPRRSIHFDRPVLLLEDAWGNRPQIGWVFGIPFRDRSPSSPIVRYPRPKTTGQFTFLTQRWNERLCQYLSYDWTASRYRVDPCSDMQRRHLWQNAARNAGVEIEPGRRPDGEPWFRDGGWKDAFPYLFGAPPLPR
jgi:hypothetical protein